MLPSVRRAPGYRVLTLVSFLERASTALGIFNNNACQESSRHLASATFGASQYRGTMYPLTAAGSGWLFADRRCSKKNRESE
jgi:hypothetical protein